MRILLVLNFFSCLLHSEVDQILAQEEVSWIVLSHSSEIRGLCLIR